MHLATTLGWEGEILNTSLSTLLENRVLRNDILGCLFHNINNFVKIQKRTGNERIRNFRFEKRNIANKLPKYELL